MNLVFFVISITALAAISPWPDSLIISRNALIHGRKHGLITALGCSMGLMIHMSYCILGIATLISSSPIAWHILKTIGAYYLIYLAYKLIKPYTMNQEEGAKKKEERDSKKSFLEGFLCDILNPMVVVFFLGVFTQVINDIISWWIMLWYGLVMILTIVIWYAILAYMVSYQRFRTYLARFHIWIDRIFGVLLIILAIKMIVT